MQEAKITINGMKVSDAMSMTIRVALESFAMELSENGLGDDAHGERMVELYLARINEMRPLLGIN